MLALGFLGSRLVSVTSALSVSSSAIGVLGSHLVGVAGLPLPRRLRSASLTRASSVLTSPFANAIGYANMCNVGDSRGSAAADHVRVSANTRQRQNLQVLAGVQACGIFLQSRNSRGNKWRRRRKMLTPAFHFRILEDFIPVFNEQAVIFVKNLKEQQNKKYIDIVPLVTLCTLDIICETAMGVKVDAQLNSNSHYVRSLYEVGETFMARVMRPWLWPNYVFYMSSFGRKFKDNLAQLHNFTRKVSIPKKRNTSLEKENKRDVPLCPDRPTGVVGANNERLQSFIVRERCHHLPEGNLVDILRFALFSFCQGHDTTAMGISWAMYLIGLYTDVQQKIHEELDAIFGEDRERAITPDDLKEMKYLECALKESQRLFPSVPFIGRELMEDVVVNGYTVPRGTTCFLFTFMLHRDKEIFPNPEVFDPDRFRPENCVGRHPFAYVPFSAGPRNCIGQKFALMEEKVVLCSVLRNFCIQSVDFRDKIHLVAELVTRSKHGLKIRLRPR
ncbi:hypothetical protein HPB51_017350 [Rhipicephalus microplus]|uniref:Cytochrome n=1 Tax=Rhipicephalus microplus TaxID=6941 RepID=A0A9J6EIC7_RHIMP|nr:hypothetical protein HPB51_017350 [Rhipicephalus microplus]